MSNRVLNELSFDAWGTPKVVNNTSLLHGMFTYNVPVTKWYESINGVEQPSIVNSTSVDGKLNVASGPTQDNATYLRTFRNTRYEPNRGYHYAISAFLPNPEGNGIRRWGYFTAESGAFFELTSEGLFHVVRTTKQSVTNDDRTKIDTRGIDLSKGHLYDIQMQWRGVGNYKFFIDQKLVGEKKYLATRVDTTSFNPSTPIAFESINKGDNVSIECGCVDISTEGGSDKGLTYGSVSVNNDNGQVAISDFNIPIIAIRSKVLLNGLINTRDVLALLATAYADQRSVFRVWATRDFSAITENDQTWSDFGDGALEYIVYDTPDVTTPMTFDTSKAELVFGCRVDQDQSYSTSAIFEGRTDIYQTPGQMFVFTMHRENGGNALVGVTYEFAEAI